MGHLRAVLFLAAGLGVSIGCDSSAQLATGACTLGATKPCTCLGGATGTEVCSSRGSWSGCSCDLPDAGPGVCGDFVCNPGEDCTSCPDDCGACPSCDYAPSCTDAVGVPTSPMAEGNLNDPGGGPWMGDYGGVQMPAQCGPAKLRMRITQIHANRLDGDPTYCIVQASDGIQSGVAITGKSGKLSDGDTYFFDPSVGIFWGQKDLTLTKNNLTITYNCIVVKNDKWGAVLMAAGAAAGMAGQFGGAYGWAFGLGDIGLQAAGAALAASSGDDNWFNAQQVIDKNELLDLTNGKTWTIQRKGSSCGGFIGIGTHDCDLSITVESWGCADAKPVPK